MSVYMHMANDSANLHNSNEHSTISQLEYSFTQSVQLMCSLKKIDQFVFRAMQNISRD